MATSVGVYEAKTHLARLLERVEKGESITITRHGRPVATLSPHGQRPAIPGTLVDEFRALRARVRSDPEGWSVRRYIEFGRE